MAKQFVATNFLQKSIDNIHQFMVCGHYMLTSKDGRNPNQVAKEHGLNRSGRHACSCKVILRGNTIDTKTVSEQIRPIAENFGAKNVTVVDDWACAGPQINELPDDFWYRRIS